MKRLPSRCSWIAMGLIREYIGRQLSIAIPPVLAQWFHGAILVLVGEGVL